MDADSLPDLAQLLTANVSSQTRAATCAAIAGCTSGDVAAAASLRGLIGTSDIGHTIIRRLLTLCGDPTCTQLALYALINLSEGDGAAAAVIAAGGVARCTSALADGDEEAAMFAKSFSGLLANLTRQPAGVDALLGIERPAPPPGTALGNGDGHSDGGGGGGGDGVASAAAEYRLLKLLSRVAHIPNVLWVSNACATPEGRSYLLVKPSPPSADKHPLADVLGLMADDDMTRRLAGTTLMRNCAMASDCHDALMGHTGALGLCLARLVARKTELDLNHIKDAPREVREAVMDPTAGKGPEDVTSVRTVIAEALLLLCASERGLKELRERDVFLVLFEWCKVEKDQDIKNVLASIMQRISRSAVGDSEDGGVSVVA